MILEKEQSRKYKYSALVWLRVRQRCVFVATEAGYFASDCLGINEKKMIEVEIKTTMQDIKNDFKKHKHDVYRQKFKNGYTQWMPTHFYFAVPRDLVEQTKELLKKKGAEKYGVIDADTFSVIKRANWIHKNEPSSKVKHNLALRMGSELLRFHEALL